MREKLSKVSACKMRDHSTWIPSLNGQYLNLAFIISYSVQIKKKKMKYSDKNEGRRIHICIKCIFYLAF